MPEYTAGRARILLEPTARGFYTSARKALKTAADNGGKPLTADVRLRAVDTGFYTDAERKVREITELTKAVRLRPLLTATFRSDTRKQVDTELTGFKASVNIIANVDLTRADAKILAWRRRQESIPLRITVQPQQGGIPGVTTGAGSRNWRARHIPGQAQARPSSGGAVIPANTFVNGAGIEKLITAAVKAGAQKATKDPSSKVGIKADLNDREMRRKIQELQRDFEDNFRLRIQPNLFGVQLRLPLGSLGTQVIPAAVAAVGSLVSALQELSQVGLALPGALSVAGASLGTLAFGLMGVGDAWKALTAEEERSAGQATTDAARMQTAHNNVRNSMVDVTRAQKDLNQARKDAKRALEDLHREEKGNNLSVAEAAINLQRARNELRRGGLVGLDRDEAVLRELQAQQQLDDALNRQKRTREDLTDATKKGVEGSDAVVNAQENLVRAMQAQTEAMTALKMESSGAANAADKVKAALENLGPEMADVVKTVWDSKPAFADLRRSVSGNMFRNFSQEIEALNGAYLPLLYRRLGGLGTVWNETMTTMTTQLRSGRSMSLVDRIFGNTAETQTQLNKALDPILHAVLRISAAGSDSMPRFARAITDVSTRLADFIDKADKDGRMQRWIDQGMDSFGTLSRIIGDLGGMVNGLNRAFGGRMLDTIEKVTQKISDFLNSSQGQEDLRIFIKNVKEDFEAWRPILQDLPKIMGAAMEAARQAIQSVLPILNVFTEILEHSPGLVGGVVTAFLAWKAINPILTTVQLGAMGLSRIITEVGTGFLATKSKAQDAATGVNLAFAAVDKADSGPAKAASRVARFGAVLSAAGGPLMLGISAAVLALGTLIDTHDAAAEAADRQAAAIERVKSALDRVTQTAGAAAVEEVAREMQDFKPDHEAGLGGNVDNAVRSLGLDATGFAASVLPGGEAARAGFNATFVDRVRPAISAALNERRGSSGVPLRDTYAKLGLSEDDVINAFLGEPAALKKYQDALAKGRSASAGGTGAADQLAGFDLADVRDAVSAAGGAAQAAGLAGQFLNSRAPVVAAGQASGQQQQRTATGKNPTLSTGPQGGAAYFQGVQVFGIGIDTNGEAGLNFSGSGPGVNSLVAELKARNNRVLGPWPGPNGPSYTVHFTEEDAQQLLSYAAGGPSPDGPGRGPTGGHIVELHSDEWVLPAHARKRLGDDMLWAWTSGDRKKKRSGFWTGGPGNLATDLPVLPPPPPAPVPHMPDAGVASGQGTGPAPGPAQIPATAPTGFETTIADVGVSTDPMAPAGAAPGQPAVPGQQPDMGQQFLNAWFPWLGTAQAVANNVPGAAAALGTGDPKFDPLSYLSQWGGNFLSGLGNTLLGGVMSFFGLDLSTYMGAMQQVVGFYGNKFGPMLMNGGNGMDPSLQALYDQNTGEYLGGPAAAGYGLDSYGSPVTSAYGLGNTALVGEPFEGSGVIAAGSPGDQAKIDASRAPNAQVIPDANIVAYIRQQAAAYGLTMGDEGKEGGNPYRTSESASLHTIGMAGDLFGTPEQRRAFLEAWRTDPILKNATRMIIDDNNTDLEMYAGADSGGGIYGRGQHGDHIHLGLEGVPGFADPTTGTIMQRNVGGGSTVVSGSNTGRPTWGSNPQQPSYGGSQAGGGLSSGPRGYRDGSPSASSAAGGQSGIPPLTFGRGSGGDGGAAASFPVVGPSSPGGQNPGYFAYPPGFPNRGRMGPGGLMPITPGGGGKGALMNIQLANQRRMGGRTTAGIAPPANYSGGNQQIWDGVYQAFIEAGFDPAEWGSLVNLLNGESGWRPTVANPSSGAFGLFQFLGATQKAYLPDKNPEPYIQAKAGMRYIRDRYGSPDKAWDFWQSQSPHWYDNAGMLPRGLSVVANQTDDQEVILKRKDAQRAKKVLDQVRGQQGVGGRAGAGIARSGGPQMPASAIPPTTKRPGPPLAPDVDIPRALPVPGISGPALPEPARQVAGAAPESNNYVHPALAKGISSGAATLGSLASTAISAAAAGGTMGASAAAGGMGAGQAGQLVSGLFQQGGKVVTGIANVVSAALTGLTKTGTTENPYGVTLKNNAPPPPLAPDNRRIHNGDNNFASMDEWRRQTQIQDAQDQQAAMTRMKV